MLDTATSRYLTLRLFPLAITEAKKRQFKRKKKKKKTSSSLQSVQRFCCSMSLYSVKKIEVNLKLLYALLWGAFQSAADKDHMQGNRV